jgi:hypothetical protein
MAKYEINPSDWDKDPIKVLDEIIAIAITSLEGKNFEIVMKCYDTDPDYFHDKMREIVKEKIERKMYGKN